MIPDVVGCLHVKLGVIWVMSVELAFSLQGGTVLSVNLEGQRPEGTLPNHTSLGVLNSNVVLVINTLRRRGEVEASCGVPVRDDTDSGEGGPELEPTLRVHVVKSEIRLTFHWSPDWETVGGVFLGQNGEGVDNIGVLE